jgi:hypothetical protein
VSGCISLMRALNRSGPDHVPARDGPQSPRPAVQLLSHLIAPLLELEHDNHRAGPGSTRQCKDTDDTAND